MHLQSFPLIGRKGTSHDLQVINEKSETLHGKNNKDELSKNTM